MGSFTKWLSDLFGEARAEQIEAGGYQLSDDELPLELERTAIQSAVGLLSSAVSQCRFRTFIDGNEVMEDEYYLWNYEPNKNQNSTQFLQDFVETLIYDNEVLIVEVRGQLFIADAFTYQKNGTQEVVFTNISVDSESISDRPASEVLFFRLNNNDITAMLSNLCQQYEKIIETALSSYERASAEKGILSIDAAKRGSINAEEYQKDLLDNKFKRFFSSQNSVLPMHAGYTYTPHKRELRNTSEINDVKSMSDEIYNHVGQVIRVPPALLRGETAQSGDVIDRFIRFGVRPICDILEEEITRKRYGRKELTKGSYMTIDTSMLEISGIFASADKLDKIIGSGILSIDEVREKVGERALGTEESQKHFITKNYGTLAGEGKEDEK